MRSYYIYLFFLLLISSCTTCNSNTSNAENQNVVGSEKQHENIEKDAEVSSSVSAGANIESGIEEGGINEILSYTKGEEVSFNYFQPPIRDFNWKWVLCTESGIPSSTVTSNTSIKKKSFVSPWYDPINVYIKTNAPGNVGTKSEAIYFIDAHYDSNGRYHIKEFSNNTETPCGIWGNMGFADQVIVKIGTKDNPLEMEVTKINNNFYTLKTISQLTGNPIEIWIWKRIS